MTTEFKKLVQKLGKTCSRAEDLDEREVVTLFAEQGFFSQLGFGRIGEDLRLETRIKKGRVDVLLRGVTGRPICVLEFKRPGTDLSTHFTQLEEYVREILPEYAALTNGNDFWLYHRRGETLEKLEQLTLSEISEDQARNLYQILHKRTVDWQRLDAVQDALKECLKKPILVTSPDQEGGQIFLQQFELSPWVAFGRLAQALYKVLPGLLNRSKFTHGAFAFWEKIYARSLDEKEVEKLARKWRDFIGERVGRQAIYRFMFALETAYAVMSRLMLAKAMQDAGFPLNISDAFLHELDSRERRGILQREDYVPAVQAVFEEGKRQAFRSLFDSDIFDWWLDLPKLKEAAHEACEALAEATLAIFQFDFSGLSGDLLGQLYQSYFDPETRRTLGEFYTPPEVVEFILDHVDYQGQKVLTQRLLDPACGSGTFLIHALRRYLKASEGQDPCEVLRGLTEGFRIVGFDINPFAVLMSQVNYALHLLPTYAKALERDREFEILTLPVFRTNSLRQEKREGEREQLEEKDGMQGFTFEYQGEVAFIRTELPIEVEDGKFLEVKIPMPRYDHAQTYGWVSNVEEYFRVQRVMFEAVRESRKQGRPAPTVEELQKTLARAGLAHAEELANYVHSPIEKLLAMLDALEREYDDGRFLKTLEDLALAMTLKHEFQYDYVVGNPPYVRIQNIPELSRKYWQGIYGWAEGNFDIFIPFIERAVRYWLKEGGRLGFICSNRFLLANYAERLRKELPKIAEIELIFDLRDTRVFKDALNYPAILIAKRTKSPEQKEFTVARVFADPGGDDGPQALFTEAQTLIKRVRENPQHFEGVYADAFVERTAHLIPQGWYLMPPGERRVFNALKEAATHRLNELTLTHSGGFQGLATGCDDVFVLKLVEDRGNVLRLQPKGGGEPVEIEKELLRPWLFGRDVERWHIAWDGWYVLFPYVKIDGMYKLIPCKANEDADPFRLYAARAPRMEDFPRAWEYLKAHEKELRNREGGRFVHDWYGAARPQNLGVYEKQKIVMQVSSTAPDAAFDEKRMFVFAAGGTSGVYGLAFDPKYDHWLLLALINSSALDFYLKHVSTVYSGHAYSYGDQFIKQLPIRIPKTKPQKEIAKRLAELAQMLTETKGTLRAKERERAEFPERQLERLKERLERYPLSRLIQGESQVQQIAVESIVVQQQPNGSWTLTFGKTTFVFPSEAHVRVAERWLKVQGKARLSLSDLMTLRLPSSDQDCRELLTALKEIEEEIEALKRELSDKEAEVNELVAEFYGLDKEDRKIIQEFLDRF